MMKLSTTALGLVIALALTAAPLASASARGWDHHWGHGGGWGYRGGYYHSGPGPVLGFAGAVVGAAAAIATAPFVLAGDIVAPPVAVAPAPAPYYAQAYY